MKRGRPSINNTNDRSHTCELCGKSYLSSTALCTHRRLKHSNEIRRPGKPGRPPSFKLDLNEHKPECMEFFEKEGRRGGPTLIITGFEQAFKILGIDNYKEYTEHPLYSQLYKIHVELMKKENAKESTMKNMEGKEVDVILAKYLERVSKLTHKEYYEKVVLFTLLYRECLDELGPNLELGSTVAAIPTISNEVVTAAVQQSGMSITKAEVVALTMNLCWWLLSNGYTTYRIRIA